MEPTHNGDNGRDTRGRFLPGNPGGDGNPHAAAVNRFRAAMMATVTEADVKAVITKLVQAAKAGEPWAVKELLDRIIGRARPTETDEANPLGVGVVFNVTVPGVKLDA